MKLIAHRGLIDGPNRELENQESSIAGCLTAGFDAEIDLWLVNNTWFLGHDSPTYKTSIDFIFQSGLWIHVKNFPAAAKLAEFTKSGVGLNYFWHENDERTLTSNGYWWTYPNKELSRNSVALMPEWHLPIDGLRQCLSWDCYAICTDYIKVLS